jgi:hypothetical protein
MIKDELTLGDVVYYAAIRDDDPIVIRVTVAGLGARVLVKVSDLPSPVEVDPLKLHATAAEAWDAWIEAADFAVAIAMRRLENARKAAAAS